MWADKLLVTALVKTMSGQLRERARVDFDSAEGD